MSDAILPYDLKTAVHHRIRECLAIAAQRGVVLAFPTVKFDIRGTTGGTANSSQNVLRFNPVLLQENKAHFLKQTVGHEVAHLVARKRFGDTIKPHGPQWQQVMAWFGLPANRGHTYDVSNVRTTVRKTYTYRCRCREYELGPRQHASVGKKQYQCKLCKTILRPVVPGTGPVAPTVAPKPVRSTGAPACRPPTPAMLTFAQDLARRRGVTLPANALDDYAICAAFLDQFKSVRAPGATPAPPGPVELKLALDVTELTGVTAPVHVLADKWLLSLWLTGMAQRLVSARYPGSGSASRR